jgi:hypothetical protein
MASSSNGGDVEVLHGDRKAGLFWDRQEEFGLVGVEYKGVSKEGGRKSEDNDRRTFYRSPDHHRSAVLARNVSTKTPEKHHKAINRGHQVVTGKGQPRTPSTPQGMVEPKQPSPGYWWSEGAFVRRYMRQPRGAAWSSPIHRDWSVMARAKAWPPWFSVSRAEAHRSVGL